MPGQPPWSGMSFSMKNILLCLFTLVFCVAASAQNKFGHTWILGYSGIGSGTGIPSPGFYGGMKCTFEHDSMEIELIDIYSNTPTGVAHDSSGNIAFYSTGCEIYNKNFEVMDNGINLNNGTNIFCDDPFNLTPGDAAIRSGTIILPVPNQKDRYVALYLVFSKISNGSSMVQRMMMAEVDMEQNNGLGRVERKNEVFIADTLVDALSAVRHANGRDWWIIAPRGMDRSFYSILLTPQGLQTPVLQTLPGPYTPFTLTYIIDSLEPPYYQVVPASEYHIECGNTQSGFTFDGNLYCRLVREQEIEIYDFDRCTGILSLRRLVPMPDFPGEYFNPAMGMALSPNSRFLYFNDTQNLYQLDLDKDSLATSQPLLIGTYDGFLQDGFFPSNFFQMRNAPDGRIYLVCGNSTRMLHYIDKPNLKGAACGFKQRGKLLPKWSAWTISYFPNFDLGPEVGTVCDSLSPNPGSNSNNQLIVQPNPASERIKIEFSQLYSGPIELYDISGRLLYRENYDKVTEVLLQVGKFPSGAYMLCAQDGAGYMRERVIIQR